MMRESWKAEDILCPMMPFGRIGICVLYTETPQTLGAATR
jgi:hypothetical protein